MSLALLTASCGRSEEANREKWDIAAIGFNITRKEVILFAPGAKLDDINSALNQRGEFLYAFATPEGRQVALICYGLKDDAPNPLGWYEKLLFAVFEDGAFVKFVAWLPSAREDYVQEDGSVATRPVILSLHQSLGRAEAYVHQSALTTEELLAPIEKTYHKPDYGLTIVMLPFAILMRPRVERDAVKNAALRAIYDGRRIRLGDVQSSVEVLLGPPVECWSEDDLTACVYRSEQRFEIVHGHHSPLIVVYREGSVVRVIGGGFVGNLWPSTTPR